MRESFNQLPAAARRRLADLLSGRAAPMPVHAELAPQVQPMPLVTVVTVMAGLSGLAVVLFGLFVRPLPLVLYLVTLAPGIGGALVVLRQRQRARRLPFPAGRYAFATAVVDARDAEIAIHPMSDLVETRTRETPEAFEAVLVFGDGSEHPFKFFSLPAAKQLGERIQEARAEAATDPFASLRDESGGGDGPRVRGVWPLLHPAVAAVVGVAIAIGASYGAARVFESRSWAAAESAHTRDAYFSYLEYGTSHRDDAYRALRLIDLEEALEAGGVDDLRRFLSRSGDYPDLDARARDRIDAMYREALRAFREQASDDDQMLRFVDRLLTHLAGSDSARVLVKFQPPDAGNLDLVDAVIESKPEMLADDSEIIPIADHFSEQVSSFRHDAIIKSLRAGFADVFSAEFLDLRRADGTSPDERQLTYGRKPDPKKLVGLPSIDIAYKVDWSGGLYSSESSGKVYVGINVLFKVAMRVPGDPEPFTFEVEVTPPDRFQVSYQSDLFEGGPSGPADSKVYTVMANRAFDQLATKLRGAFFAQAGGEPAPGTEAESEL
jgi:hypothetical protein